MPKYPENEKMLRKIEEMTENRFASHTNPHSYINTRSLVDYQRIFKQTGGLDIAPAIDRLGEKPHVLDIGCGVGNALSQAVTFLGPEGRFVGITALLPEVIPDGVEMLQADAQKLNRKTYREELGLPDGSFDIIFAVHIANYLADPAALLEGIYALLKENSEAFIFEFPTLLLDPRKEEKLWNFLSGFGLERYHIRDAKGKIISDHQQIHMHKYPGLPQTMEIPITAQVTPGKATSISYRMYRRGFSE